ncbi:MAG TPA: GMC family oxidoreductase [Candidatus Krumholzibacteria bacterium]|nr:GMC family oxidoreductase [Candidatus Krumholzibacteria bacterium]
MPVIERPEELCGVGGGDVLRARVCVIGSGFAGALLAVELVAAGIDVLLLEAGSRDPDHALDRMLDRVAVTGSTELRFGFARQLGGASNLWAGRVAPLEPIDFESRDWIPASGWPLSRADLEPYHARADGILGIAGYSRQHESELGPPRPGFMQGMPVELKAFEWAQRPFNAGAYLLTAAAGSERLRVVLNAPVVQLVERGNARSVEAALVALAGGGSARVEADAFVVAAGGIQTPRLLLNSTAVRAAGIGGEYGVTGRYLSTHPKANMATVVVDAPASTRHPLFSDRPMANGVMRYGVGFDAATQREHRLLNHYVQFLPFAEYRANRLFERFRGSDAFNSPLIDRSPLISGTLTGAGKIAFEMMGRLGGVQRRARKFVLRAFLDQYPNPDNRITLSGRKDAHGMPLANLDWSFSSADRESVIRFFALLERATAAGGHARLDHTRLRDTAEWPLIGIHSHFMGTTRMGDDPRTSVTNSDGRVHGSENVYVTGPSLFPASGYANPAYSIAALSLRLADHLQTVLRSAGGIQR